MQKSRALRNSSHVARLTIIPLMFYENYSEFRADKIQLSNPFGGDAEAAML